MIYVFGSKPYGVVDQVPGLFHVGTRCFHIQYVPLVPLGSILVLDQKLTGQEGMYLKIPFSLKSFFFTYLRLAIVIFGIASPFVAVSLEENRAGRFPRQNQPKADYTWLKFGGPALAIFAWWGSRKITHASPLRALELADHAGLDRTIIQAMFAAKGHPIDVMPEAQYSQPPPRTTSQEKKKTRDDDDDVFRLE